MPPNRFTPAIRRGFALAPWTLVVVSALLAIGLSPPAGAQNDNRVPVPLGSKKGGPVSIAAPPILVVEPVAMMLAAFDTDGDGRVTRDEMRKGVAKSFDAIDTGHTGKL